MLNSINLSQHMATARKDAARCLNWIDATTREPLPDVQLDNLISSGTTLRKRLQACKESLAEAWDPSWTNNQYEYVKKLEACSRKYDEWLGRWQRARAEADTRAFRASTARGTAARCVSTFTGSGDTCTSARARASSGTLCACPYACISEEGLWTVGRRFLVSDPRPTGRAWHVHSAM